MIKRFSSYYVLLHFHEENKFSVIPLKDAVTTVTEDVFVGDYDLSSWDSSKNVEASYGGKVFPARFLQFGFDKKSMDVTVNELVQGKICPTDIDVIQKESLRRNKNQDLNLSLDTRENNSKNVKRVKKSNDSSLIKKLKETIPQACKPEACKKCIVLDAKMNILLQNSIEKDLLIKDLEKKVSTLKAKYRRIKEKYSLLKETKSNKSETEYPETFVRIGPNLSVDRQKLSCCRNGDFSKFTGDLLDVVFGPDVLGRSVLKGIGGCQKDSILDKNIISDIQIYVAKKFAISQNQVRVAIRQKLNMCHKALKVANNKE